MAGETDDDEADDGTELFRNAVRGARPLAGAHRASTPTGPASPAGRARPPLRPRSRRTLLDERAAASVDVPADSMTFRRPGVPEATLRRLRRGQIQVQAEIDLHGLSAAQGEHALREFLEHALGARLRCVRVVHGKGLRSGERGPVLRDMALAMLRRTGQVQAFVAASPFEGGQGAVRVLLAAR